jgi:hypothetical protein
MSIQTKADVKQLHRQAILAGAGQQFLAAFQQIVDRLRKDPLTFGEPLYRLPVLKLAVRKAVLSPLVVDYAVHEEQPLVFIRGFKILS